MEIHIKNFIIKEFKDYQIVPGYHTFNVINNQGLIVVTLKAEKEEYSYLSKVKEQDIKKRLSYYLLIDNIIVKINPPILTIETLTKDFDEYKFKLKEELPELFSGINLEIDYKKLYYQLKTHRLTKVSEEEYSKICKQDDNYYNDLYMDYWNLGTEDIDLSNGEIIKAYYTKLNYDCIIVLVRRDDLFGFIIKHFEFNDPDGNYSILKNLTEDKQLDKINILIDIMNCLNDQGLLVSLVSLGNSLDKKYQLLINKVMDWELISINKYLSNLINICIQNNNIYILTLLIKKGFVIKAEYLLLAKELKRDRIYSMIAENL